MSSSSTKSDSDCESLQSQAAVDPVFEELSSVLFSGVVAAAVLFLYKWIFTFYFPFPLTLAYLVGIASSLLGFAYFKASGLDYAPPDLHTFFRFLLPFSVLTVLQKAAYLYGVHHLSLTLTTVFQTLNPVLISATSIALSLESFSQPLVAAFSTVLSGVLLTATSTPNPNLPALAATLAAIALYGLRFAVAVKAPPTVDRAATGGPSLGPAVMAMYAMPVWAVLVAPAAVFWEGPDVARLVFAMGGVRLGKVAVYVLLLAATSFGVRLAQRSFTNVSKPVLVALATLLTQVLSYIGGFVFFAELISVPEWFGFAVSNIGLVQFIVHRYDLIDYVVDLSKELRSLGAKSYSMVNDLKAGSDPSSVHSTDAELEEA